MKERPILFSGPMVRAILRVSKTQTRRVVKLPALAHEPVSLERLIDYFDDDGQPFRSAVFNVQGAWFAAPTCPYGAVGDRLWVRETWQYADWTEDGQPYVRLAADNTVRFCDGAGEGETLVDVWAELSDPTNYAIDNKAADRKWRPPIFMPRWASRITLTITDVRVQRLQDISEADAVAEGVAEYARVALGEPDALTAYGQYAFLWDSLNAKRAPWESNPWVWAITFERAP